MHNRDLIRKLRKSLGECWIARALNEYLRCVDSETHKGGIYSCLNSLRAGSRLGFMRMYASGESRARESRVIEPFGEASRRESDTMYTYHSFTFSTVRANRRESEDLFFTFAR